LDEAEVNRLDLYFSCKATPNGDYNFTISVNVYAEWAGTLYMYSLGEFTLSHHYDFELSWTFILPHTLMYLFVEQKELDQTLSNLGLWSISNVRRIFNP